MEKGQLQKDRSFKKLENKLQSFFSFLCTAAAKFTYNPPLFLVKLAQDFSAELPKLQF